jgi:hypothetical protein
VSRELARELILLPGQERPVRMMATSLAHRWAGSGGQGHVRIFVEEPSESDRPPGSIRLESAGGTLGKIVLLVR